MRFFTAMLLLTIPLRAAEPTAAQVEHFEKQIRPLLIDHCYSCHSEGKCKEPKGGLRVDGREHLLTGGDTGPAIVVGDAAKSRLIEAVKYANSDLQMPPKGKLTPKQIQDLETWIKDGAAWPGPVAAAETKAVFDLAKRKAEHWAWQPVKVPAKPTVKDTAWPNDSIDHFILEKLEAKGLTPAADADPATWLRRVTFAITGLPPTPDEVTAFLKDPAAREQVVDRLLASPAYGERWGRHWLDLIRYAESLGHEFDFDIANAWHYRDYVVRFFNEDLSYALFVLEHLCGDSLMHPRRNGTTNEAVIGTAFWRLGEEVQSPVDIRQDQADRFDNRIDVMSKAFLGLTVSCARCHDHKFDAISTKDYYALFGLLQGSSDAPVRIDGRKEDEVATAGRRIPPDAKLVKDLIVIESPDEVKRISADRHAYHFLYTGLAPHRSFNRPDGFGVAQAGSFRLRGTGETASLIREERAAIYFDRYWQSLAVAPGDAAEFGKLGHLQRAGLTLRTPRITLEKDNLYYLVRGGGMAFAAVGNHTTINGPLHGALVEPFKDHDAYRWVKHSLKDYKGQTFHVELTADPKTEFAVVMLVQADDMPPLLPAPRLPVVTVAKLTEIEADLKTKQAKYLAREPLWTSRVVPAFVDNDSADERVFIRGNPRTPGEVVPHRGLEALHGPAGIVNPVGSGRQEWALQMIDTRQNPFLARVMVNRVWHHLFGRGIVASVDNFGVLGERPSHPELLDHLAIEFGKKNMQLKPFIKRLVLSRTYMMDSTPRDAKSPEMTIDPANLLLHTFRLKRLEGEAIRDSILMASGRLDRTVGGPPVPIHLTAFMDGRGKPKVSGPLDGAGRRSIYMSVRRNFLSPFLLAFDTPIPFSTVGRRQVSNVPAQALLLMNDPFVHGQAEVWGKRMANAPGTATDRISDMYMMAFARKPTPTELENCAEMVAKNDAESWAALAHAIINVKEFIFVK